MHSRQVHKPHAWNLPSHHSYCGFAYLCYLAVYYYLTPCYVSKRLKNSVFFYLLQHFLTVRLLYYFVYSFFIVEYLWLFLYNLLVVIRISFGELYFSYTLFPVTCLCSCSYNSFTSCKIFLFSNVSISISLLKDVTISFVIVSTAVFIFLFMNSSSLFPVSVCNRLFVTLSVEVKLFWQSLHTQFRIAPFSFNRVNSATLRWIQLIW